jgi:isoquinoline 1-oxidoreductase alpha subunit
VSDADLEQMRNVCRCGTYPRIREAIRAGEANMPKPKRKKKAKPKRKAKPKPKPAAHKVA